MVSTGFKFRLVGTNSNKFSSVILSIKVLYTFILNMFTEIFLEIPVPLHFLHKSYFGYFV